MADRPAPVTDLAWSPEQARELGAGVLDLWTELLERLPDELVTRERAPLDTAAALALPVPEEPMPTEEVLAYLRELTFEQSLHMGHPAYFAYITGAGTVPGAAAEFLAAGLNQCSGGYRLGPGAAEIELHLTRWLASRFGLPEGAGGMIMTGGAMANFVGLKCARDQRLGSRGARARRRRPPARSPSTPPRRRTSSSAAGRTCSASAPTSCARSRSTASSRLRVDALRDALARDVADGVLPLAISATAGTTTTGSVDPLPELAALAREHGAWFHVDAAYGGAVVLSDRLRPLLAGTEHADSIAVDPHKWMYTPQSAGCVLLRDFGHLRAPSTPTPPTSGSTRPSARAIDFAMHGPQFSRGFAALKVWISLLAHGRAAYARRIEHDVALASYLAELVEERGEWELMCPPRLSICCFRHRPQGWSGTEEELDRHNERLMTAIHADGRVYCSNAVIDGRFGLRACIVNFRTEAADVERLLDVAEELGAGL